MSPTDFAKRRFKLKSRTQQRIYSQEKTMSSSRQGVEDSFWHACNGQKLLLADLFTLSASYIIVNLMLAGKWLKAAQRPTSKPCASIHSSDALKKIQSFPFNGFGKLFELTSLLTVTADVSSSFTSYFF